LDDELASANLNANRWAHAKRLEPNAPCSDAFKEETEGAVRNDEGVLLRLVKRDPIDEVSGELLYCSRGRKDESNRFFRRERRDPIVETPKGSSSPSVSAKPDKSSSTIGFGVEGAEEESAIFRADGDLSSSRAMKVDKLDRRFDVRVGAV